MSALSHLDCPRCGLEYDAQVRQGLCTCGSPLLARYDLTAVRVSPSTLAGRAPDLWRYAELLPVREPTSTLSEGFTPLFAAPRFGAELGLPRLLVKDEGALPTGSFKARGAAVGVARAAELGVRHVAMPTNGNAGAAWATYAARAGLRATIAMPTDAPTICRQECRLAGAELILVDGHIGDAGAIIRSLVGAAEGAIVDVSTLKEPYRVEGKKTMGLEIAEQLGWTVPDVIVYPTGGGVGLIGIHKALQEARVLGWIPDGPLPRLVAVQSTGCAPIVRAFQEGAARARPWADARTVAFGINVPAPLGDELILRALAETGGTALAVTDAELLADQAAFARQEGLMLCPEGAAGLTALRYLVRDGWVGSDERVVVLNTGSGLKYPRMVA